jgi:hypothetical protein
LDGTSPSMPRLIFAGSPDSLPPAPKRATYSWLRRPSAQASQWRMQVRSKTAPDA